MSSINNNDKGVCYHQVRRGRKRDIEYCYTRSRPTGNKAIKTKEREPVRENVDVVQPCDEIQAQETADNGDSATDEEPQYLNFAGNEAPVEQNKHLSELKLDGSKRYAVLLVSSQSVVFSRYLLTLARLNEGKEYKLHRKSYVAVIKLGGRLYCSCDGDGLERAMTATALGVRSQDPVPCSHLEVLEWIDDSTCIEEWVDPESREPEHDDHDYSSLSKFQVMEVAADTRLVYSDRRFGTVHRSKCDCDGHCGPCQFIKLAGKAGNPEYMVTTRRRLTSLSWSPISFMSDSKSMVVPVPLDLEPSKCRCGSEDMTVGEPDMLPLYSYSGVTHHQVRNGVCLQCSSEVFFDGSSVSVINMGLYLVHHNVLHEYLRSFLISGMSLFAFFKQLCWRYSGLEGLTYGKLRLAWIAFHKLLDYGSSISVNMICNVCGAEPRTVICDGVTMSFEQRYLTSTSLTSKSAKLDGSNFPERLFIPSKEFRKELRSATTIISADLLNTASESYPWLFPTLSKFSGSTIKDLPQPWKQLIFDVSASTPATALVDMSDHSVEELGRALSDVNHRNLETLKSVLPVFYNIIRVDESSIDALRPILKRLIELVDVVYQYAPHTLAVKDGEPQLCDSLPSLPQICERGSYKKDKAKDRVCNKKAPRHRTLTSGIFTLSCPHGICYGFELMPDPESPNVPFTILRTRFINAPDMVVYDNSCNLKDYCLNRDPGFFKHTKFFVDRFHWVNHKDCSSGFDIRMFARYQQLNTQVAEQLNSKLGKLRSVLSYCNEENFRALILTFIWYHNTLKLLKSRTANNGIEEKLRMLLPVLSR